MKPNFAPVRKTAWTAILVSMSLFTLPNHSEAVIGALTANPALVLAGTVVAVGGVIPLATGLTLGGVCDTGAVTCMEYGELAGWITAAGGGALSVAGIFLLDGPSVTPQYTPLNHTAIDRLRTQGLNIPQGMTLSPGQAMRTNLALQRASLRLQAESQATFERSGQIVAEEYAAAGVHPRSQELIARLNASSMRLLR